MSSRNQDITPAPGGVFQELTDNLRLVLRLMGDPRVNPLIKLLPLGTLIYFIVPDLAPGPFDDALVAWVGNVLFIHLCPPDIVEEHREALRVISSTMRDPEDEIIDAEVHDVE